MKKPDPYQLSQQIGYNLRRANQRHVAIFAKHVDGLTPTQFAVLARLWECGALSQNKLGRLTAMDSATIKGVVERLRAKGLVHSSADQNDQRLRLVDLTQAGRAAFEIALDQALAARTETVERLTPDEIVAFEALLAKLI
ncbi:MarR family transcriptional regulator [Roseobacter cerasinus]|uniref:MarR family transcriptional regulator n=1 Tax=Roseobacter cerasinus TaxID=2602289 RepID=A0A640VVH4_9RHOB|nr:MarR family transcriptional regulator [Roseobacter cerasinus]GFE51091.1 MarR family transcriptional regulator [Roseobacter cerasinus]